MNAELHTIKNFFEVVRFCATSSFVYLQNKTASAKVVGSINVDCTNGQIDPMTNAFIQMSGVFAELELRIIRERVRSGMQNAKAKGVKIGRPQTTVDEISQIFSRLSVI